MVEETKEEGKIDDAAGAEIYWSRGSLIDYSYEVQYHVVRKSRRRGGKYTEIMEGRYREWFTSTVRRSSGTFKTPRFVGVHPGMSDSP